MKFSYFFVIYKGIVPDVQHLEFSHHRSDRRIVQEERFLFAPTRLDVEAGEKPWRYTQNDRSLAFYSRPSHPPHFISKKKEPPYWSSFFFDSGKGGIRTLGTVSCTLAFQASTFNHSATFPKSANNQQITITRYINIPFVGCFLLFVN